MKGVGYIERLSRLKTHIEFEHLVPAEPFLSNALGLVA